MADPIGAAVPRKEPVVWALLGAKAGDNAQILALARALGIPFVAKRLELRRLRGLPNWILGASTVTLSPESRPSIAPPWPSAVIASGMRSVPVARYIRQQSGNTTRLIHLGRPRAPLFWFDLVITTPQYRLPQKANVIRLDLPFPTANPEALDHAATAWRARLGNGQRTIALLVGGDAKPWRFDERCIDLLAASVTRFARERSASLLVTCGRRLPQRPCARLREALGAEAALFHAAAEGGDNPYHALLALADEFVVTTDSVSQVAEALETGRPVHLFAPMFAPPPVWRLKRSAARLLAMILPGTLHESLVTRGFLVPQRRTTHVMEALVAQGRARWLDAEVSALVAVPASLAQGPGRDAVVRRVRELVVPPGGLPALQEASP